MKKYNDEIINRRKFFKKAANIVIPVIALSILPSVISSCEIDEEFPETSGSGGCSTCKGSCSGSCGTGCSGSCGGCSGSCVTSCKVSCSTGCGYNSCKGSCSGTCNKVCRTLSR